jgi:hypothetical protein
MILFLYFYAGGKKRSFFPAKKQKKISGGHDFGYLKT